MTDENKEYAIYYEDAATGHHLYARKTKRGALALFDRLTRRDNAILVALHDGDDYAPVIKSYTRRADQVTPTNQD